MYKFSKDDIVLIKGYSFDSDWDGQANITAKHSMVGTLQKINGIYIPDEDEICPWNYEVKVQSDTYTTGQIFVYFTEEELELAYSG